MSNDIFISCKNLDEHGVQTRDSEIAAEVYNFLTGKGLSVFLSTFTLEQLGASDYTKEIDSALESATVLLAIGTSADHLNSEWVRYEWVSFANDIRSRRKLNGRIFTYIEGMPITALPRGLRQTQTFVHYKDSLERLYNFIAKALSPSAEQHKREERERLEAERRQREEKERAKAESREREEKERLAADAGASPSVEIKVEELDMSGPTDWGNSWVGLGPPLPVGLADKERMAVAQNKDGHLEVFVVGSDGAVWHRWQVGPNGNWSEWASFGQPDGVSFAVLGVPPIQVKQNADGRLEVFLQGNDNNVWHIWQVVPNANWIDHWTSLSRPLDVDASAGFWNSLVRNQGSELEIFVQGVGPTSNTEVWSIWQVKPNGIWADSWTSLGAPPSSVDIGHCFPVLNANNVLEVLAIGFDQGTGIAIWHNVRDGIPPTPWRGWSVMIDRPSGVNLSDIEGLWQNQDGRLELVCTASNRDYWHTWQSSPSPDNWSGFWDNFGQPPGGALGGDFDMRLDTKGLLEGLTWGNDFATYLISQSAPNNGWTGWGGLSRINVSLQPKLIMSQNQDGRLEAFTRSSDIIWHIAQHR